MPIKKSLLYSSLWAFCDELRGGMDASQYKDYVLVLLFIKYISDKYAGQPYAPITIPAGASFRDMVALKDKLDIGDQINKKIIAPLASANKLSDFPDFNDSNKLGSGKEMVDRCRQQAALLKYVKGLLPNKSAVFLVGDSEFGSILVLRQLDQWHWSMLCVRKPALVYGLSHQQLGRSWVVTFKKQDKVFGCPTPT
jgi:hypothetical protein